MVRNARRNRLLAFVAVALAGLMAAPLDACDDYAFLNPCVESAHAGAPDDAAYEPDGAPSETAHKHFCTCVVCYLTTDDSYTPTLPSPAHSDTYAPAPFVEVSCPYVPAIFRPPIA